MYLHFFLPSALDGGEWHGNTQPGTHEVGYPVDPQSRCGRFGEDTNLCPAGVRTPDRPARSIFTLPIELAGSLCSLR